MPHKTDFPDSISWYTHFVSYGETDMMGVLYYAEYLHLFERSRALYIRERGMSYAEVEKRGVILPVREAQCRYRAPIHFDEEIQIKVGIDQWKRASMRFVYEIWNDEKSIIHATGMTEHAAVSREGKPVRIPEWLRELFA